MNTRIITLPLALFWPIEAVDEGNVLTLTLSASCFLASTWGAWRCCSRCERWTSTPELRSQGEAACTRSSSVVAPHLSSLVCMCGGVVPPRGYLQKCRPFCSTRLARALSPFALFFHIRCVLCLLNSFCSIACACTCMLFPLLKLEFSGILLVPVWFVLHSRGSPNLNNAIKKLVMETARLEKPLEYGLNVLVLS